MKEWSQKIELELNGVKLLPLEKEHKKELLQAASDGELWNLWVTSVPSKTSIDNYIATALSNEEEKNGFALYHQGFKDQYNNWFYTIL